MYVCIIIIIIIIVAINISAQICIHTSTCLYAACPTKAPSRRLLPRAPMRRTRRSPAALYMYM